MKADVAVVGGGIIGLATAHAVLRQRPRLHVVVLEKEDRPAAHQSGRNSGVIHSGIYYRPGSLKARTVAAGRRALVDLCRSEGIPYRFDGKVIVASVDGERPQLQRLRALGRTNGVAAELIGPARLRELEPHAVGVAALHVPSAGVVDFARVCETLARLLTDAGAELRKGATVLNLAERHDSAVVATDQGDVEARVAVNCAGLYCDRLVPRTGSSSGASLRIIPFRGEYRVLRQEQTALVRSMIYPVPDPRFPFLGPHFTRGVEGQVHAGPNAVLALAREGYSWRAVNVRDTWDVVRFPGFLRLVGAHWRTGVGEVYRSLSAPAFARALQRLVPDVAADDFLPAPAGVRAQAVDRAGVLVDDFVVHQSSRLVHVLNAPSPAATASLEIGRLVAGYLFDRL